MMRVLIFLFWFSIPLIAPAAPAAVRLILDTDIGNDIDDTLALAMIHALENRGEVKLLAVTITKDNQYAAPFVDLVNTFYGRPEIPIGVVSHGKTPEDAAMIRVPAEQRNSKGSYLFPHRLTTGAKAPQAVELLEKILQGQPDQSVTIAQIGFSTNLAKLLESPGGPDLIRKKVKLLAVMGGNFAEPKPEYNIYIDRDAAALLLSQWPGPMVFSGYEIGSAITFPFAEFSTGFPYTAAHPIVASARSFFPKPEDRPAWDPTAVLYAIRPDAGYFQLSRPGRITLTEKNTTVFQEDPEGHCRHLIIDPEKTSSVRQLLVDLVTEPPAVFLRR